MANLLPCPFCGKPTEYVCENDHHGDYFRLGCTDEDCPAHWTYYTEPQENAEECIRRWNTRAAQPPAAPVETPFLIYLDEGDGLLHLKVGGVEITTASPNTSRGVALLKLENSVCRSSAETSGQEG